MTQSLLATLLVTAVVVLWFVRRGSKLWQITVPVALLPLAAAATSGAWQLRATYTRIAETGAGGLGTMLVPIREYGWAMLSGAAATVVLLGVVVLASVRDRPPAHSAVRGSAVRKNVHVWIPTGVALLVTAVSYVVLAADRLIRHTLHIWPQDAPFASPWAGLAIPDYIPMLERAVVTATQGGIVACLAIAAWAWIVPRLTEFTEQSRRAFVATVAAMAIGLVTAGWYGVRIATAVAWIERTQAQLR